MRPWSAVGALSLVGIAGCTDARGRTTVADAGLANDSGTDAGMVWPRPIASRVPLHPPPPISGGTLLLTRDGERIVAADPDQDRVFVIGKSGARGEIRYSVLGAVDLPLGTEPGRLAEDGAGRVHVVLRRGGGIGTVDVGSGELLARRTVCPEPRGIAYDPVIDRLHVACASGDLVSLEPASGKVTRRVHLDVDLRDVVIVPGGLVVSRFKTAELLRVDGDGNLVQRVVPGAIVRGVVDPAHPEHDTMTAGVAWRTVATSDGHVLMLHQYGVTRALDIGEQGPAAAAPPPAVPVYGAPQGVRCGGIVEQAVSELSPDGTLDMGMPLPVRALTVDVAVSPDGTGFATVHPGSNGLSDLNGSNVKVYRTDEALTHGRAPVLCAPSAGETRLAQPVAVVTIPGPALPRLTQPTSGSGNAPAAPQDAAIVVQNRQPSSLVFYDASMQNRLSLSLVSAPSDSAHATFHTDSGGGIACAQCHPEGGEDGRVWSFSPIGPRRTQALRVGLEGTEPFHWSGTLPDFTSLVHEVFERRMGGAPLGDTQTTKLRDWVFSLPPPDPIRSADAPEVRRGRALFESPAVGCLDCHDGAKIAKSSSMDVGVGSPNEFQIPSLRGVGYRAPFLHDGCAATLRDRFDPACGGGDKHGKTSQLAPGEIDDLVAYLESL